jgi:Zinc dependent phospholipase C
VRYFSAFLIFIALQQTNLYSYSVLTHEAIIDSAWKDSIQPLLLQRFPRATAQDLKEARAYVYGGSLIQDMGYYPFGSHFFTDLTHYVSSGDFVTAMLRDSKTLEEYAFALGALAHYAADTNGHAIAVNRVVPMLYPKLRRKYGDEVTYADDASSHLKTEFGFDVLQVAKGRYASDAYHDFIGFEVSKPLLERAFRQTYGLELKEVFGALDLAIGTYRRTVSGLIPKMTRVAWETKKDDIAKSQAGIVRDKFLYNLSRAGYEKDWGKEYRHPGIGARILAFVIQIVPKVGPLRSFSFRTPTPEMEKLFMASFNATRDRYKSLLEAERTRQAHPADVNLDVGKPTAAGMYRMADLTYAKLVDELAKDNFAAMPRELRADILNFYKSESTAAFPRSDQKRLAKLQHQLEMLRATAAYSRP